MSADEKDETKTEEPGEKEKKLNWIEKSYMGYFIRLAKKKLKKTRAESEAKNYSRAITEAKKALIEIKELVDITDDKGKTYTEQRILMLSDKETMNLLDDVLQELEKLVR